MADDVGPAPPEPLHVGEIRALLALPELAPAHVVTRGALEDRFVDVSDVLDVADRVPGGLEDPRNEVEREERVRAARWWKAPSYGGTPQTRNSVVRCATGARFQEWMDGAAAGVVEVSTRPRTISSRR